MKIIIFELTLLFLLSASFKSSQTSFLFSLKNRDDLSPFKASLKPDQHLWAIWCYPSYGPTFGDDDMLISSNSNTNKNSYSNFGHTYQLPAGYTYDTDSSRSLLTGSCHFTPCEIEVFYWKLSSPHLNYRYPELNVRLFNSWLHTIRGALSLTSKGKFPLGEISRAERIFFCFSCSQPELNKIVWNLKERNSHRAKNFVSWKFAWRSRNTRRD